MRDRRGTTVTTAGSKPRTTDPYAASRSSVWLLLAVCFRQCHRRSKNQPRGGATFGRRAGLEPGLRPVGVDLASGSVDGGGFADPTFSRPVAVTVHLEDVDMAGQAVGQCAGQAFGAEALGPFVEGQMLEIGVAPRSSCCETLSSACRLPCATSATPDRNGLRQTQGPDPQGSGTDLRRPLACCRPRLRPLHRRRMFTYFRAAGYETD